MKYCRKKDLDYKFKELRKKNKSFTEKMAIQLLKHLLKGLKVLSDNGILHRDLKPPNILIADDV